MYNKDSSQTSSIKKYFKITKYLSITVLLSVLALGVKDCNMISNYVIGRDRTPAEIAETTRLSEELKRKLDYNLPLEQRISGNK